MGKRLTNKFNPYTIQSPLNMPKRMMHLLTKAAPQNTTQVDLTALAELNQLLKQSLTVFASDTDYYPEQYLRDNSLTELIQKLRKAEQEQKGSPLEVRKALATSRALAVNTQKMIDQRLVIPEVFEGRASPEGLKALADMATERLHTLVS